MLSNPHLVANEEEAIQRILYGVKQKGKIKKTIKGGLLIEALGIKCFMPMSEYGHYKKGENLEGKEIFFSSLYYNEQPIVSRVKTLFDEINSNHKVGDTVKLKCTDKNKSFCIFSFKNGFDVPIKIENNNNIKVGTNYNFTIKSINNKTRKVYLNITTKN